MPPDAEIAADKALLNEFAELAMDLARDLHACAKAAETPEEKAKLAQEFHRVGRGLRQTLALKHRLTRDLDRAAREARTEARDEAARAVERRKARVSAPIERLIWTEYEDDEANSLVHDLSERLSEEAVLDGFTTDPVEMVIERICEALGIPSPLAPRVPSPLAGEGVGRSPTDEGSHGAAAATREAPS